MFLFKKMLSSRTIRTLTLFVIGAVFLNITVYTIWWFQYQQTKRFHLKKIYAHDTHDYEPEKNTLNETEKPSEMTYKYQSSSTLYEADISNTNEFLHGITRTLDSTTDRNPATVSGIKTNCSKVNKKVSKGLCHEIPSGTGLMPRPLPANTSEIIRSKIKPGGHFKFDKCKPRQRIAVFVTLRYGQSINEKFLLHMHTFLIQQESEYHFFVIGQNNTKQAYNQGRLFNIGYLEVRHRFKRVRCFIFHEDTVYPLDSRNIYRCMWYPRQLVVAIENNDRTIFYPKFGYAIALTAEQFSNANGFTNGQWTLKSGYDNIHDRLLAENYEIERSSAFYGKYFLADNAKVNFTRLRTRQTVKYPADFDGLSTLAYTVACYEARDLYTYISVVFPEECLTDDTTTAMRRYPEY